MNMRKLIPHSAGLILVLSVLACSAGTAAPTATAPPPTTVAVPGHITGRAHLQAPPSPAMVVYAVDSASGLWVYAEIGPAEGEVPFDLTVQPGTYQVFAFVADQPMLGMGYVNEGTTLTPITVASGQTVSDINVRPPGQGPCGATFGLPASPDGRFAAIPGPTAECINGMGSEEPSTGAYVPVPTDVCQTIKESAEQAAGLTFTIQSGVPFQPFAEVEGQACSLTATTTGAQIADPFTELTTLVSAMVGWTEETSMQAGGPTGASTGLRRDSALMIIRVQWQPAAEVQCPADQPISACDVKPEQQIYTIKIDAAMK